MLVELLWGSMSRSIVFFPLRARPSARLIEVVVFPSPPFWFVMEMVIIYRVLTRFGTDTSFSIRKKIIEVKPGICFIQIKMSDVRQKVP